jgi:hypothetical protein
MPRLISHITAAQWQTDGPTIPTQRLLVELRLRGGRGLTPALDEPRSVSQIRVSMTTAAQTLSHQPRSGKLLAAH